MNLSWGSHVWAMRSCIFSCDRKEGLQKVVAVGWNLTWMTKARATRFRCTIPDVTSIPELSLLCTDCLLPMKREDFPQPHACATQIPVRTHRLPSTGWKTAFVSLFSHWRRVATLPRPLLLQVGSCLHPSSFLRPQARNQKSMPQEWCSSSEGHILQVAALSQPVGFFYTLFQRGPSRPHFLSVEPAH